MEQNRQLLKSINFHETGQFLAVLLCLGPKTSVNVATSRSKIYSACCCIPGKPQTRIFWVGKREAYKLVDSLGGRQQPHSHLARLGANQCKSHWPGQPTNPGHPAYVLLHIRPVIGTFRLTIPDNDIHEFSKIQCKIHFKYPRWQ